MHGTNNSKLMIRINIITDCYQQDHQPSFDQRHQRWRHQVVLPRQRAARSKAAGAVDFVQPIGGFMGGFNSWAWPWVEPPLVDGWWLMVTSWRVLSQKSWNTLDGLRTNYDCIWLDSDKPAVIWCKAFSIDSQRKCKWIRWVVVDMPPWLSWYS